MNIPAAQKVSLLSLVIETKTTREKQAALLTLGNLSAESTSAEFGKLLDELAADKLPREIRLELAEAIDSTHSAELAGRLKYIHEGLSPDPGLRTDERSGGNTCVRQGRSR